MIAKASRELSRNRGVFIAIRDLNFSLSETGNLKRNNPLPSRMGTIEKKRTMTTK